MEDQVEKAKQNKLEYYWCISYLASEKEKAYRIFKEILLKYFCNIQHVIITFSQKIQVSTKYKVFFWFLILVCSYFITTYRSLRCGSRYSTCRTHQSRESFKKLKEPGFLTDAKAVDPSVESEGEHHRWLQGTLGYHSKTISKTGQQKTIKIINLFCCSVYFMKF